MAPEPLSNSASEQVAQLHPSPQSSLTSSPSSTMAGTPKTNSLEAQGGSRTACKSSVLAAFSTLGGFVRQSWKVCAGWAGGMVEAVTGSVLLGIGGTVCLGLGEGFGWVGVLG